jgi:hypothetical protein
LYVPGAAGVQLPLKLAVVPLIVPCPVITGVPVQPLVEYRLKVTFPVGLAPPDSVAVSLAVIPTPTVPVVGLATVVTVGVALPMITGSSPQAVAVAALLLSPLKLATHSYVPAVSATKPVFV